MNKNKYDFWKKSMVLAIIGLFLGAGVVPSISEDINDKKTNLKEQTLVDDKECFSSGTEPATDWWPMFHHDLQHSGYSTSDAPETNNVKWTYTTTTGNRRVQSSPVVADGKVYIGSNNNKVYCLNAATNAIAGDLIWSRTTGDDVWSSPAVVDGKVFIGSKDNKVYCLDAANGDIIWYYRTGDDVWSSPAVVDGKVYIGSDDNKVYCLNAETGHGIWYYRTGSYVESSPAVVDGKVYIGSDDGKVYCLDAATGDFIWSYTAGRDVFSSPAVVDGKVYIGSLGNKVYCLDAATGDFIWSYTTGGAVRSSPAVCDGKVYVGSWDNKVYCLDAATGDFIWSYRTGDDVWSSPAVCDGKVYIGSDDGKVYCLDAATGDFIWSYRTGDDVWSSPAVCDGKVYIGSDDGKVYCFEDSSGNNPPNAPDKPFGATSVIVHCNHRYQTSAVDPDGDRVQYFFDWGDGECDWTIGFVKSGETDGTDHIWREPGVYQVKAKARDILGAGSDMSVPLNVTVEPSQNHPPNKPCTPNGPASGKPGKTYKYSTYAIDPDGDQIEFYMWGWGDGVDKRKKIYGPFESGEITYAEHAWAEKGNYDVKVWAEDVNGLQSYPSDPLIVSMPKCKPSFDSLFWFFERFIERFPFLEKIVLNIYERGS